MEYLDFIRPELLTLVPLLYVIGMMLKQAAFVRDNIIPLILGGVGVLLAICYVCGDTGECGLTAIATAITQGILCAGVAVYGNQIFKQIKKGKQEEVTFDADDE